MKIKDLYDKLKPGALDSSAINEIHMEILDAYSVPPPDGFDSLDNMLYVYAEANQRKAFEVGFKTAVQLLADGLKEEKK